MREQTLRASSSYPDRAEYRPAQGQSKAKTSGARSRRGTNLGLLGRELGGLDLLGAALGLSSEAVNILVDGRDHAREHQYGAHLAARMKDAGIPASWLDQAHPKVSPEYLSVLRKFAAASNNKAPIRRANFRRIASAFENREQVLADALEMVASAVINVAEGQLEFDDGRFGHINPILMRAGFPDSWLEQAEPDLTDAMLLTLEQLATDDYERKFEEESSHSGQVYVSPAPEPQNQQPLQPTAAPVDKSKETVMAPKTQPQPPAPAPAAPPAFQSQPPEFKAGGMPTAGKPMAHPTAGAPRVSRTILAAGRKLPGAAAKGPAAKGPAAKAAAKSTAVTPPTAAPTPPSAAASSPAAGAASAPQAAPDNRRGPNARGTVSKEASLARADALEKLLENARRGAKAALWRDVLGSSLAFWGNIRRGAVLFRNELAAGVEQALGLPKGWLDNPTFPPPQLAAFMTDKDAPIPPRMTLEGISDDNGQSAGQGENEGEGANAAPEQAAAPATTSAPAASAGSKKASETKGAGAKGGAAQPKRDATKPFAQTKAPQPPKVSMTQQPPSTPPVPPSTSAAPAPAPTAAASTPAADPNTENRQLLLVDMGAPAPGMPVSQPGAVQAVGADQAAAGAQTPAAQAPAAQAPAPTLAPVAAAPSVGLTPAGGSATGLPGPLTQALMSIISAKATAGTFTEADALSLINQLMAR